MDIYQKFIIEEDEDGNEVLIIGKSTFHKQLAFEPSIEKGMVKGGGSWKYGVPGGDGRKTVILSGTSHDYGSVSPERLKACISSKHVYTNYTCTSCIADDFNFVWMEPTGKTIDL